MVRKLQRNATGYNLKRLTIMEPVIHKNRKKKKRAVARVYLSDG